MVEVLSGSRGGRGVCERTASWQPLRLVSFPAIRWCLVALLRVWTDFFFYISRMSACLFVVTSMHVTSIGDHGHCCYEAPKLQEKNGKNTFAWLLLLLLLCMPARARMTPPRRRQPPIPPTIKSK